MKLTSFLRLPKTITKKTELLEQAPTYPGTFCSMKAYVTI